MTCKICNDRGYLNVPIDFQGPPVVACSVCETGDNGLMNAYLEERATSRRLRKRVRALERKCAELEGRTG